MPSAPAEDETPTRSSIDLLIDASSENTFSNDNSSNARLDTSNSVQSMIPRRLNKYSNELYQQLTGTQCVEWIKHVPYLFEHEYVVARNYKLSKRSRNLEADYIILVDGLLVGDIEEFTEEMKVEFNFRYPNFAKDKNNTYKYCDMCGVMDCSDPHEGCKNCEIPDRAGGRYYNRLSNIMKCKVCDCWNKNLYSPTIKYCSPCLPNGPEPTRIYIPSSSRIKCGLGLYTSNPICRGEAENLKFEVFFVSILKRNYFLYYYIDINGKRVPSELWTPNVWSRFNLEEKIENIASKLCTTCYCLKENNICSYCSEFDQNSDTNQDKVDDDDDDNDDDDNDDDDDYYNNDNDEDDNNEDDNDEDDNDEDDNDEDDDEDDDNNGSHNQEPESENSPLNTSFLEDNANDINDISAIQIINDDNSDYDALEPDYGDDVDSNNDHSDDDHSDDDHFKDDHYKGGFDDDDNHLFDSDNDNDDNDYDNYDDDEFYEALNALDYCDDLDDMLAKRANFSSKYFGR